MMRAGVPSAMNLTELRSTLAELGLRPRRSWGQHFLVDHNILRLVIEAADVRADETVLEVGPGLGVLTEPLLERARQVIAIERDPRLAEYLRARFPSLEIIVGDAATVPLPAFDKLVANLPYQITTPLLERVVESAAPPRCIVVMVQREVADRLAAQPRTKEYGALTVLTQRRYDVEVVHGVSARCFYPPPAVDSAIVRLLRREPRTRLLADAPFHEIVRAGFGHRRKMLGKLLAPFGTIPASVARRRAEELSLDEWIGLANQLRPVGSARAKCPTSGT
ncbi:MAG: 16S rRNA (adenine(1518)-N(6)/adenine(1519)-N(6))-dimethyltransferase RsmA [Verrucomicrobiae bacterium]|nr:16S rRNA (adenine(1518)-N(6)/adenine(1519)-N(6))-dimethyltransferase RsmA [Verrucomicrobiae bacterium]